MDYVEAASQLGQAIAESGEFIAWREAEEAMNNSEEAQALLKEYKDLQIELAKASRNDVSKEDLEEIRNTLLSKQAELNSNEIAKNYFATKKGFENVMKTINEIIQFYLTGSQGSCGGNCSSCGGCH